MTSVQPSLFSRGSLDFWRLWLVGAVLSTVRWLETIVVAVFVYNETGSPFLVAVVTMLRLLPMSLFGAFLGVLGERLDRRIALIVTVVIVSSSSLSLAILAWTGQLAVWHVMLASLINGIGAAADNPIRRALIGEVVGPYQMATAMSLDTGANNASRMLGPFGGGLILASVGIGGVFAVSVGLYAIALAAALAVQQRDAYGTGHAGVLERIVEGFVFVRRDRRLVGVLVITVIYNVFGWPFTSMIPVIAQEHLQLGAKGIGILASLDGVGAFLGALLLMIYLRQHWYARVYVWGVASYLSLLTLFAVVPHPLPAGAVLVLTGIGSAGFSTMQATLVYLFSPPEMRSRILGVLSVCIGIGPIGFIGLGALANLHGANAATAAFGLTGLVMLGLTRPVWRHI
jgi:MFS family permease